MRVSAMCMRLCVHVLMFACVLYDGTHNDDHDTDHHHPGGGNR